MNNSITIEGLEFTGMHGWYEHERQYGCQFSVDLTFWLDLSAAGQSDKLGDSVDYAAVAGLVFKIGQGESHRLIEHLAERIIQSVLDQFPRIEAIDLTLRKLHPPMAGAPKAVALRIHRSRESDQPPCNQDNEGVSIIA